MELAGQGAIVTGATSGLGRAVACALAGAGARVAVHGRDASRGGEVVDEILHAGGEAIFVAADLAEETQASALVDEAAARLGGLHILVNNAVAHAKGAPVADVDTAAWERVLRVDLTAAMWTCRGAIPHMRAAGHGAIVNVSSRAAQRPSTGLAAYVAAKGGLEALTRAIAVDHAADGIRANAIAPGYVRHDRRDAELSHERRHELEAMHLLPIATAAQVAAAVVWLAGPGSATLTGAVLPVDGGSSITRGKVLG